MSAERNSEALPESIDLAGEDVIYLKEALQMLPSGVKISESRFRQWCKTGRYGEWVLARPCNHEYEGVFTRVKHAWLVLTGRCDAVKWYKQ